MPYRILHIILSIFGAVFFIFGSLNEIKSMMGTNSKKKQERSDWLLQVGWWSYGIGLVLGMLWSYLAYGYPWIWDPKEIATLLVLVFYYIHSSNWLKKQSIAPHWKLILSIIGIILVIGSFIVPFLITTYHQHLN